MNNGLDNNSFGFRCTDSVSLLRVADLEFKVPDKCPDWFLNVLNGSNSKSGESIVLDDSLSFVGNFAVEAEEFWRSKPNRLKSLKSGVFMASSYDHRSIHIELVASQQINESVLSFNLMDKTSEGLMVGKIRSARLNLDKNRELLKKERVRSNTSEVYLSNLPMLFLRTNVLGDILDVRANFDYERMGYGPENIGLKLSSLDLAGEGTLLEQVKIACSKSRSLKIELQISRAGSVEMHQAEINPISFEECVVVFRNITERSRLEGHLRDLAFKDALTGLPNRHLLQDRLERAIVRARREKGYVGVLFLDLDGFKSINDSHGHSVGDTLLVDVSKRLRTLLRETDTVIRLGGDEFLIVIEGRPMPRHFIKVAQKIVHEVARPYHLNDELVEITTSVGLAVFPRDGMEPKELVEKADAAMYRAKSFGKNQVYDSDMGVSGVYEDDGTLADDFCVEDVVAFFQPIVDPSTGDAKAIESLARWYHPSKGIQGPSEFFDRANEEKIFWQIDRRIFKLACECLEELRGRLNLPIRLSANVSQEWLRQEIFEDDLINTCNEHHIEPAWVDLELDKGISERILSTFHSRLKKIRSFGFNLSLDDFGTGQSSLRRLVDYPIDVIKVDSSFMQNSEKSETDFKLCKMIVDIANTLDLKLIAQGVETETQKNLLQEMGCTLMQGYLFAKPLAKEQLLKFIESC